MPSYASFSCQWPLPLNASLSRGPQVAVTARGGIMGVNHVAHLGGAAAGLLLVFLARVPPAPCLIS
jgi:membrane associated rhomboid family serine protease